MTDSKTPALDSIFGPIKRQAPRLQEEIDFSAVAGNPEGTNVIYIREPSPQMYFKAEEMADEDLKRDQRSWKWPKTMRGAVALLALCHVAPMPPAPRLVLDDYLDMASDEEQNRVLTAILKRFGELFPQVANIDQQIKIEKKG